MGLKQPYYHASRSIDELLRSMIRLRFEGADSINDSSMQAGRVVGTQHGIISDRNVGMQ